MILTLLAFLLPHLIGLAVCTLLATRVGRFWLLAWLAPAVGMGISSVLFFLWSLIFYPRFQPRLYLGLEGLVLAALLIALWRLRANLPLIRPTLSASTWEWLAGLALLVTLFFFTYRFVEQTLLNPLGSWDAWTIWNYRARYLLLGDAASWRNVFSIYVNHGDYPYLLSGFIARGWVLTGKDRLVVPVVTEGLFALSTIGFLVAAVAQFRGLGAGFLAGTLLASLPIFLITSSNQYSDVEVACYFLAALVFLYENFAVERNPAWLIACGVMTAFGLWTKNEGFSFLVSLVAALVIVQIVMCVNLQIIVRRFLPFAAGLLPVALLALGYKIWLAPPSDLFENRSFSAVLAPLADLNRYTILGSMLLSTLGNYGLWKIPFLPTLAVFTLVTGLRKVTAEEKTGLWLLGSILALTFVQYMGIYLITPHDLYWHISTSIGRLFNQLLPGGLFVLFLLLRNGFESSPD